MEKQNIYIGVNIDWSKSFVDENGGFYAGTIQRQKDLASKLMPHLDLVIYATDFHSIKSKEFQINGGMWPLHNVAEYKTINPEDYGLDKNTTLSPEQTKTIDDKVNKTKTGIIVPKHVYYQDGSHKSFEPKDVENAFDEKIITPEEFVDEDFTYIISLKTHFDATRNVSDYLLPESSDAKIPNRDYTVFDLLAKKYPSENYNLIFVNTGVVENICRHYTSTGLKQNYPDSRVINLEGATTELAGIGLGFEDKSQVKDACARISKDIGVEYMSLDNVITEIKKYNGGAQ
jgi:hypothetical protein